MTDIVRDLLILNGVEKWENQIVLCLSNHASFTERRDVQVNEDTIPTLKKMLNTGWHIDYLIDSRGGIEASRWIKEQVKTLGAKIASRPIACDLLKPLQPTIYYHDAYSLFELQFSKFSAMDRLILEHSPFVQVGDERDLAGWVVLWGFFSEPNDSDREG